MLWNDSLLIGVESIDVQHKELVSILESFLTACKEKKGRENLNYVFSFLKDYTIQHFFDEEQEMKKNNYPNLNVHKQQHTAFIAKVKDIEKSLEEDLTLKALIDTNKVLTDWLVNHISKTDKEFANFLRSKK